MRRLAVGTILISAALALSGTGADAADVKAGALQISAPWARATPKGAAVGGGYFNITNTGAAPDRLVGGSTGIAGKLEIHEMSMSANVMKMRPVSGLEIGPGQSVEFKPGGLHLMFVGLNRQLQKGDHFKATLQFEKAGAVEIDFSVAGVGATSAAGDSVPANMSGMSHDNMGGMKMK